MLVVEKFIKEVEFDQELARDIRLLIKDLDPDKMYLVRANLDGNFDIFEIIKS